MKKLFAFIIFLLFLLLIWFSWNWYKTTVACCENVEEVTTIQYGPLIFDCNSEEIITNDLWPAKKREILSLRKSGTKLLIIAPDFNGEDNKYSKVRAVKIATLFKPELSDKDIVINVREGGDCESTKTNLMHESRFKWFAQNGNIVKYHDHTAILYEYDSTEEVQEDDITTYFNELAKELKASGKSVTITGYTDSDGDEAYNKELGLKRAKEFEMHLLNRGVSEDKITVNSMGESMPVATNRTPEGKKQNRRVEIKIN